MTLSGFADIITIIAGLLAIVAFFIALEWRQTYQDQQVDQITQEILVLLDSLHFNIRAMRGDQFRKISLIEKFSKYLPKFIENNESLRVQTEEMINSILNEDNYEPFYSQEKFKLHANIIDNIKNNPKNINKSANLLSLEKINRDSYKKMVDDIESRRKDFEERAEKMTVYVQKILDINIKITLKFKMYSRRKGENIFKLYQDKINESIIVEINNKNGGYRYSNQSILDEHYPLESILSILNNLPSIVKQLFQSSIYSDQKDRLEDTYGTIGSDEFSQEIEKNFKEIIKKLEDEGLIKQKEIKPQ
jgi:hypothetical protein